MTTWVAPLHCCSIPFFILSYASFLNTWCKTCVSYDTSSTSFTSYRHCKSVQWLLCWAYAFWHNTHLCLRETISCSFTDVIVFQPWLLHFFSNTSSDTRIYLKESVTMITFQICCWSSAFYAITPTQLWRQNGKRAKHPHWHSQQPKTCCINTSPCRILHVVKTKGSTLPCSNSRHDYIHNASQACSFVLWYYVSCRVMMLVHMWWYDFACMTLRVCIVWLCMQYKCGCALLMLPMFMICVCMFISDFSTLPHASCRSPIQKHGASGKTWVGCAAYEAEGSRGRRQSRDGQRSRDDEVSGVFCFIVG